MLVVLDSNVVAAAAELREDSFTYRAVIGAIESGNLFLVSPQLQREYARVLNKPELVDRHRLDPDEQSAYLGELFLDAVVDVPPRAVRECPDSRDQMLWDLLEANSDAVLVTGEHQLQESNHFPGRVLSPRDFVQRPRNDA